MPTAQEKLDKFKSVMAMIDDSLTRSEFLDAFKQVVAQIQKLKLSNEQDIAAMREHIRILSENLSTSNANELAEAKQAAMDFVMPMMQQMMSEHEQKMALMQVRIDTVKDGQDGKDGRDGESADSVKIVTEVITRLSQKENRAPITDGPDEIRNKLELLQDDARLDKAAIRGLDEWLEKAVGKIQPRAGWGAHPLTIKDGSTVVDKNARIINFGTNLTASRAADGTITVNASGGGSTAWSTPVEAVNGVTTVFPVDAEPTDVVADGVLMFPSAGYTYAALQITFTNAPSFSVRYR